MMDQINVFVQSLEQFWLHLSSFLPQMLGALLLLIAGWLIAKLLRKIAIKFLKLIRLDVAAEKSGIEDFLIKGGVRYTTVTIVANLIYWFLMFTVMLAVLNSLGLEAAAGLFNRIILYIPNVIVAVLVLMFGSLFAKFVQGVSFTYLSNIGIAGAQFVSILAQWAIIIFVVSVALEQLSIGGQILVSAFQIAFGALCLALALAFGLGGREWAASILDRMWKK
ncbi:MAG: hypothetical protein HY708_03830 [Ignavibacteriae bacterium]|nr:hypothetical protein [Ignavibacteriota bacterium]